MKSTKPMTLALALLTCWSTPAQDDPTSAAGDVIPDVVYGHKLGMALTLDVFKPSGDANGAGILYMVSGGWISRWRDPERIVGRLQPLLDKGFTVFAVRHGSSPRFKVPEAVADVRRAVQFVHANAADFEVDPKRLGVYGGSAGGHLSLMLGLAPTGGEPEGQVSRIAAVVSYFPPVDLREIVGPSERFPALEFDPADAASISPILFASENDPPTLLIHGTEDRLVPIRNSEAMFEALQENGVRSEFIAIEGASHGFRGEHGRRASEAMVAWFEEHLVPKRD